MKKTYMTPEADKIEFNYRDQVVAASAGDGTTTDNGSSGYGSSTCDLIDQIFNFLTEFTSFSICSAD